MRLTTTLFQRALTRALPKAGLLAGLVLLAATSWSHAGSNAGDDIPTAGRSLFDILTTVQTKDGSRLVVPFPYENLRALIAKTGDMKEANLTETHIPLGRSLQREAAAPNFFASPRLLLGVTGETPTSDPATTLVLKDRLYVGYQPRAGTLEVISFNEQAGRFEFQIVEDYAPGMTPRTVQARRPLCLSCHHGGGPIFSDPPWSETPANPRIAARLNKAAGRSPDDPQIIRRNQRAAEVLHRSVRGANRLAHLGNLWTGMCSEPDAGRNCKTGLLSTVLEHRLSGRRSYGQGDLQTRRGSEITLEKAQRLGWPNGIAIASPFIADRDPLSSPAAKPAAKPSPTSSTTTDPLASRPPIRRLDMAKPGSSDQIIDMLGDLFTAGDIRWLDSALLELAENVGAPRRVATVPCALQRAPTGTAPPVLVFLCNNRVPGFP
ncbi:MAG: hypothetical protein O3B74_08165, partial [Proteobacteria bacterium]|nr:hypothetical protein [Pseudomonadota bacterium]